MFVGKDCDSSSHILIADKVCPAVVTSHSTVTPKKAEYNRGEEVTVTCDEGYVVNDVRAERNLKCILDIWCKYLIY